MLLSIFYVTFKEIAPPNENDLKQSSSLRLVEEILSVFILSMALSVAGSSQGSGPTFDCHTNL